MNYVNRLKNLSLLEMIGLMVKKYPKKSIVVLIIILLLLITSAFTPQFVYLHKKSTASNYINKAEKIIITIRDNNNLAYQTLKNNKNIYKEFNIYINDIDNASKIYNILNQELNGYKKDLNKKNIKSILKAFDKKKVNETLIDKANNYLNQFTVTYNNISDVKSINLELLSNYEKFSSFKNQMNNNLKSINQKLNDINKNAKNQRVKNKANEIFSNIEKNNESFNSAFTNIKEYNNNSVGKYNLTELQNLKESQRVVILITEKDSSLNNNFTNYWNELNEEYYTIVTNHYYEKTSDTILEPNPMYREWTEQESYQDTETKYKSENYTERVYKGSRIVGDIKQDIYENEIRTKQVPYTVQVTKTRTVKKNNGQPITIPIFYDVYKHYYTIEKNTSNHVSKENIYVGKKHQKYDSSIRYWNYKNNEEEGYVVWKQLWNDNEGIVQGQNIKPKLER